MIRLSCGTAVLNICMVSSMKILLLGWKTLAHSYMLHAFMVCSRPDPAARGSLDYSIMATITLTPTTDVALFFASLASREPPENFSDTFLIAVFCC